MDKIERLKELLILDPSDCFLLHALGLEYLKKGNLNEATTYFETVLGINEWYIGTYYWLGKTLEKTDIKHAKKIYNLGIEKCKKVGDTHAANELMMALEDLEE